MIFSLLFLAPFILGYDYGVDLSDITSEDDLRDLAGEWDYDAEEYVDGEITNEDYETLRDLFDNKVNLNTADRDELYNLPEIGYNLADRIIEYRKKYGLFKSKEEIKKIPGITLEIYEQMEPFIEPRERRVGGGCTLRKTEEK
ncbi:hypothetical protein ES703_89754 [subsurface metagenome]